MKPLPIVALIVALLAARAAFAQPATDTVAPPRGRGPRLLNQEEMQRRGRATLARFTNRGMQIDGSMSVLLSIDETSTVRDATPNSGNRQLDRALAELWKKARFEPFYWRGCRLPVWFHVPLNFASDFSYTRREMRANMHDRPASGEDGDHEWRRR